MEYKNFIIETLEKAALVARDSFGKVSGVTKSNDSNQVLTETDLAVGKLILEQIGKQFPSHNIIDEEAGIIDQSSSYTWVVDPIDGTSNFASGVPTYGIMLGLLQEDVIIAGGIILPSLKEIYVAAKGQGTFCNGQQIHVTQNDNLLSVLVSYGIDGHQENTSLTKKECEILSDIILHIRNLRSSNSCYDPTRVAKGSYGAYINQTQKIWDNVAEQIIVEEAGGIVTDYFGKPLRYPQPLTKMDTNYTICAAAPMLHKQLQDIIQKYS